LSVAATSQVRVPAMFLVSYRACACACVCTREIIKHEVMAVSSGVNVHMKLRENRSDGSKVEWRRHTQKICYLSHLKKGKQAKNKSTAGQDCDFY
jgi:hypothetical protein